MLAKSTLIFHSLLFQIFKYMNKIVFKPNPHRKFDKNPGLQKPERNGHIARLVKCDKAKNLQQSKVLAILSEAS